MRPFVRGITTAAALALLAAAGCSSGSSYSERTYQLGQRVQLGNLVYNVFDSQWLTHMGEPPATRVPDHRFFLVRVSITNSGGSDTVVPPMTLTDENGKTYMEVGDGDKAPQWLGLLRHVRPAESLQGNVLFDCPPRRYKLRISDESESRAALVDIPLTFVAETPEIPSPQLPEKK